MNIRTAEKIFHFFFVLILIVGSMGVPSTTVRAAKAQTLPPYAFPRMYIGLDDRVSAEFWTLGSTLTLTIDDDANPDNGFLYQDTELVIDAVEDVPVLGVVNFRIWQDDPSFDVLPNQYVTISDGTTSKSTWIQQVTFDAGANGIASGTGPAGRTATVDVQTNTGRYQMDVVIDESGNWLANFDLNGPWFDYADWGTVDVWDEDGDSTVASLPYPITFGARPATDTIEGWEWPVHQLVTITVDDPLTGASLDMTMTALPSWVEGQRDRTLFTAVLEGYDLKVGDIVTVTNGTTTKQHIVRNLVLTGYDLDADTISGAADSGQRVNPYACTDDLCGFREETTGSNGIWQANFAIRGDLGWEDGIVEVRPGSWIDSTVSDEDGDVTQAGMQIPNLQILSRANEDRIEGNDWPVGSTVTIEIDDPLTAEHPDKSLTTTVDVAPWDPNLSWFNIYIEDYDLKPGDMVTVTEGNRSKELLIQGVLITDFDLDADIVYGKANAGQLVYIQACGPDFCVTREETADLDGNWEANFAVHGDQDWEQDTADIYGGMWIDANINDADGDMSRFGMNAPNVNISASVRHNCVWAGQWPEGMPVTLTIDDPNTGPGVDYQRQQTPESSSWDPYQTFLEFCLGGFQLRPGHLVTATNGEITKTLVVADLAITNVNVQTDVISGFAESTTEIFVFLEGESFGFTQRRVLSGTDGTWSVDFSLPDPNDSENPAIDIVPGLSAGAIKLDDDGDFTEFGLTVDWVAPPSIPLVFAISNAVDLSVPVATLESISVLNTLNDALFRLDANGNLLPLAATEHTVSADGLVYTVALRLDGQ